MHGITFAPGPGCTWWVMQKDEEVQCVPQGDLFLGENSQQIELYDVNCQITLFLHSVIAMVDTYYTYGINLIK